MRGVTVRHVFRHAALRISTHTPRERRDGVLLRKNAQSYAISTHTPREGRDAALLKKAVGYDYISTHTPRERRDRLRRGVHREECAFQLTRLVRGVTTADFKRQLVNRISTHTPRERRDIVLFHFLLARRHFNSHAS